MAVPRTETHMAKLASLVFGENVEMVKIESVRASNVLADRFDRLVCIFVGGTGGIGESTARELFLRTRRPKVYIIGRSIEKARNLVDDLRRINPDGQAIFLARDCAVIRDVDEVCAELQSREPKIHCLFLTAGYMTLKGRTETEDGLDRKMAINYYARIRFIQNLMPQLKAASDAREISRVITVLAAGSEGEVRMDDLDLKHNFTLHACLAHCVIMTDFMVQEYARKYPHTAFSHSYPGTVKTGIANELTGPVRLAVKVMYAVVTPWILNVKESGERHLFQMTSACYPARNGGIGIPTPEGVEVMEGMDGEKGSGGYLLDWDGKPTGDERLLNKYRELNMGQKVWDHTMGTFARIESRMQRDNKRAADGPADGSGRTAPETAIDNPIGWRPA